MPGSGEVSRATQAAFSSGAPSCGQRFNSAKNSPLTWNTTMSRPAISTTLLPPAGISVVRATVWRAMLVSELVDRAGIGAEDLLPLGLGERRLEGEARIVKVPVRIVRREQQPVDSDPFDQRAQMPRLIRLVNRLRREPEVLADIFRRFSLEMWHLAAEAREVLVHPPHRRRDPAETALDEDDLQFWKALEHALNDQACKLRRNGVGVGLMLLDIIGRPAAAGRRVTSIAADMDPERQIELLRALVDRPVAAAAERLVGARRDVDLDVFADLGTALDLVDRKIGAVLPDQDRGLQARIAVRPERQLPVVDGALDRGAEFEILLREDEEIEYLQDPELDVERSEMLFLHEGEVGARRSAGRRPGIASRDQRRGARIGRGEEIGRAQMTAIFLQMLLPSLWQELV